MKGVSVIICCYNSAGRLSETLFHLSRQIVKDITWELIIVDNNSIDNTSVIAKDIWRNIGNNIPMKVVFELTPGLSHARLKGLSESLYNLLLFCDDDNWLAENYITKGHAIITENPQLGIVGGKGFPFFEQSEKPEWFDSDEGYYAVGAQGVEDGDITLEKGYVYGAGTFIQKRVFEELFRMGFSYSMEGRKGENLSSSEDMELGYAAVLIGFKIGYYSTLTFRHFIPNSRLNIKYLAKLKRGIAKSSIGMLAYEELMSTKKGKPQKNNYLVLFAIDLLQFLNNGIRRFLSVGQMKNIRTVQMNLHIGRVEGFLYFKPYLSKNKYANLKWYIDSSMAK